ncbi:SDR family NAD(P)-dependent oxidoreductase [Lentzea kentuckyensis]|uniref:SDR family NAD(P)-dependent oxidoreductase n=1 Tax=Lentzea kentuckyensis TaxID=360086 RepID=UPI000A3C3827|nr:SDR family NAD(P)-dependent oxidoreductase [Lentzea kentuckyensis]
MDRKSDYLADQTGRTAIVTGAGSGLGLVVAAGLAELGAQVIMAVRNPAKVNVDFPAEVRQLDLMDLDSVRRFAAGMDEVDLLVNNAGIAGQPHVLSPQGHESHFATNHLGHFALTRLLLPKLDRVVTVSSYMYKYGQFGVTRKRYSHTRAYADSKLANVLFGLELHRRAQHVGSYLAHPGMARTSMQAKNSSRLQAVVGTAMSRILGRSAEEGARPILYAATAKEAPPATLIGPGRGAVPRAEKLHPVVTEEAAEALWEFSERVIG